MQKLSGVFNVLVSYFYELFYLQSPIQKNYNKMADLCRCRTGSLHRVFSISVSTSKVMPNW